MDQFTAYLKSLPKIDFVYCGLPKPEYFRYWYRSVQKNPKITYKRYMGLIGEIILELNAAEYHLEVNVGNKDIVLEMFKGRDYFQSSIPIYYSAPIDSRSNRYAKKRKQDEMLVFSNQPMKLPTDVQYSHQYLDHVLSNRKPMVCFDPAIGKGLLVKFCLKHGHSAHGIDMNMGRLRVAMEMVEIAMENNQSQTNSS